MRGQPVQQFKQAVYLPRKRQDLGGNVFPIRFAWPALRAVTRVPNAESGFRPTTTCATLAPISTSARSALEGTRSASVALKVEDVP